MEDKNLWHTQLFKFLRYRVLPKDLTKSSRKAFKIKAFHFCMIGYILYRRGFDGILLRCLEWAKFHVHIMEFMEDILVPL